MERLVAEDQKDHRSKVSGPLYRPIDGSCVSLANFSRRHKANISIVRFRNKHCRDSVSRSHFGQPSSRLHIVKTWAKGRKMQGRKGKRTFGPHVCLLCPMGTVLEAKRLSPEAESVVLRMKIPVCPAGIQESCLGVEAVTRTATFIVPALCDRHSSVSPLCSHTLLILTTTRCSECHYYLLRRVD